MLKEVANVPARHIHRHFRLGVLTGHEVPEVIQHSRQLIHGANGAGPITTTEGITLLFVDQSQQARWLYDQTGTSLIGVLHLVIADIGLLLGIRPLGC